MSNLSRFKTQFAIFVLSFFLFHTSLFANSDSTYTDKGNAALDNKDFPLAIDYFSKVIASTKAGEAYWGRAVAFEFIEDYQNAINDYDQAIELYTSNKTIGQLYLNRALCQYYLGSPHKAAVDYDKALAHNFNLRGTRNKRSIDIVKQSEAKTITHDSTSLSELKKDFSIAYYITAKSYYSEKQYNKCIRDCDKAIYLSPDYVNAYYLRAYANLKKNDPKSMLSDCDKCVELDVDSTFGYYLRSSANYYLNEYEKSLYDANKIVELDSTDTEGYELRTINYYSLKNYDKAIENSKKALALYKRESSKPYSYINIARSYLQKRNYEEAIAYYTNAIKIKEMANSYFERAQCHRYLFEYSKAMNDCSKGLSLAQNDTLKSAILTYMGLCKMRMGNYRNAESSISKSIDLVPSATSYLLRGKLKKLFMNRGDESVNDFKKAIELDRDSTFISSHAYCYLGQSALGYSAQAKIIEQSKDKSYNYFYMACLKAYEGESEEAINFLERALMAGFENYFLIEASDELVSLRKTEEFKKLLAKYEITLWNR